MIYFLGHADYLVVSRFLGTTNLGFYEFSYRIPHLVRWRFSQPLSSVLFPVLVKSKDLSRSLYGVYTVIKINAIVSSIILLFLAVFSREIILFLWGEKWLKIVTLLIIASIGALIECIISVRNSIFLAFERPDLNFKSNFLHAFLTIILLLFLTPKFGLQGAALAVLLGLTVPVFYFVYSLKILNGKIFDLLPFFFLLITGILIISFILKIFIFPFLQNFNFYLGFILVGFLYLILTFFFVFKVFSSFIKEVLVLLKESFR
ncbi:oligosaccharide flippase family protein [Thermodesulfatator indicus]|uniref:oligosaccharide flippase family protein n=1 Tax=Thermodesulfatator indicus TaxID=171695 RepID=UPI0003129CFA|nr:oligosaccharide flippase family protein [Thermodesulfatator indicus]